MENTVLKTYNLSKAYGRFNALDDVNLTIKKRPNIWIYRTKWSWQNYSHSNNCRSHF